MIVPDPAVANSSKPAAHIRHDQPFSIFEPIRVHLSEPGETVKTTLCFHEFTDISSMVSPFAYFGQTISSPAASVVGNTVRLATDGISRVVFGAKGHTTSERRCKMRDHPASSH